MSDKQPEALKLSEQMRDMSTMFKTPSHEKGLCNGASFELRRQHAEIQRLQDVNKELLEALKDVVEHIEWREKISGTMGTLEDVYPKAKAAITSSICKALRRG